MTKMNQTKDTDPSAPAPAGSAARPPEQAGTAEAAKNQPLQADEKPDESVLESVGKAISAPVRDAAEDEERKQTGQRPGR